MKKKQGLRVILYALAILIMIGWIFIRNITRGPLPDFNEGIELVGLQEEVEVFRDSFGVPHIFAENETDLYKSVGYVMAQDRLWQMDLLRRVTTGRLAEILSDDLLEVDQLMRSLEMTKKSANIYANADQNLKDCILAFSEGVNQFIEQNRKHLPFEFKLLGYSPEPWEPVHSINLIGYMAWDLSTGWPNELTLKKIQEKVDHEKFTTLVPNIPGQSTSIYPEFELDELGLDIFRGSNNWVVSGSKTKSGDTLVMINKFTHRGPVVTDIKAIKGKTISMNWIGLLESNEILTVYKLNRAKNWGEFREAIKTFISVNQNIVYADTEGNIGLHSTIGIPIRESGGMGVYPGDTSLYDWKGLVPFEELPYQFNPECGYLSSANNRTADPDYPYYISSWFDLPYRQDRIQELLESKNQIEIEDFIQIHADQKSKMAEKFNPVFVKQLLESDLLSETESQALDYLREWDFDLSRESIAATIFEYLYYYTCKELVEDELGEDLFKEFAGKKIMIKNFMENILADTKSSWCDNIHTEDIEETFKQIVLRAFKESLAMISTEMGPSIEKWEWGKIHQFTIKHPLASAKIIDKLFELSRGPFPVGGSHHTVSPYSYNFMDPASVYHGSSHRHIYDLSNWDNSLTIIPTGNSGIPTSPHYCDQSEMYINNEYHTDYVSRSKIEKAARYRTTIISKLPHSN